MLKGSISLNLNSATEALIIICRKFLNKYSWERHRPNTFNSCSSAQLMLKQLTELNFKMILSFYPAIEISPLGFQKLCCIHLHSGTSQTSQMELFAGIVNARYVSIMADRYLHRPGKNQLKWKQHFVLGRLGMISVFI